MVWRNVLLTLMLFLTACGDGNWNNPYPDTDDTANTLYDSFDTRPKHLDPAQSYSSNEYEFIANIYMPPLQYHYLKRPYTLVPLSAAKIPSVKYLDSNGKPLPANVDVKDIAFSEYTVTIRPGIKYQPHPAFAKDSNGEYLYHNLGEKQLENIHYLSDFDQTDTRELIADDFVYQLKRLAHPKLHSPIYGLMSEYIVGLPALSKTLKTAHEKAVAQIEKEDDLFFDLRQFELAGVKVVDRYSYTIRINGKYPQMIYWMTLPFFSPMPVEADMFYSQAGLADLNINLDWYPVGTGPYMLTENNPNLRMVLERNPHFGGEFYPADGEKSDADAGLLSDAGKPLPFINKVVFNLEKENIPYWNKFLQGYYDKSGISSDSFDQAISVGGQGEPTLTEDMQQRGMSLLTAVSTSISYTGFNMSDELVGGDSERARKLRRAIAIAVDFEEYISIFLNGRGLAAQGPLPPGIFGYQGGEAGMNSYIYDWVNGKPKRKSIDEARKLLAEAGYANGVDPETGAKLIIYLDSAATGPDAKSRFDWWRKQLDKINIDLVIRSTDYNRFQEKMLKGTAQIFQWGWNADYPDPENFMFLLYGPNKKIGKNGENAANYDNPAFNTLFDEMKNMENGSERQVIIDKMVEVARRDSPWRWGMIPKGYSLQHAWYKNAKPNLMANNTLKYKKLDPGLRAQKRLDWNKPIVWPLAVMFILLIIIILPAVLSYRRKEHGISKGER